MDSQTNTTTNTASVNEDLMEEINLDEDSSLND
jgi:hypothetical protein